MKIDKTFKIKEKYFNAILRLEKPFELRHEKVEPNSIIKLECENGKSLIFRSGEYYVIEKWTDKMYYKEYNYMSSISYKGDDNCRVFFNKEKATIEISYYYSSYKNMLWYDNFCWNYINEAPTYLIEIAEILEVK